MKTRLLIPIAVFLVTLPWLQGLSTGINSEVMFDGVTTSAIVVMTTTLSLSLISWALFSWASKSITSSGVLLAIISGASLVIPFLQVLGSMAGMVIGIVAGFVAFMLQKKMNDTTKNRPVVIAGITLAAAYVTLTLIVLAASQTSHVWDTGDGVGSWTGTAEGVEESGFGNVFNNNIGFVFFFAIIPSIILTERIIGSKK